jgi:hypothetical protein
MHPGNVYPAKVEKTTPQPAVFNETRYSKAFQADTSSKDRPKSIAKCCKNVAHYGNFMAHCCKNIAQTCKIVALFAQAEMRLTCQQERVVRSLRSSRTGWGCLPLCELCNIHPQLYNELQADMTNFTAQELI